MYNVFIDGQVGTTGLQIFERLKKRDDIILTEIPYADRKNDTIKREYLNSADLVILCLPDQAARVSVKMVSNPQVKILDASTAHRTEPNWVYGLPELNPDQREKIRNALFVANPGCYSTGFLLGMVPLIKLGIVNRDYPISINAVSGYSGGGRQLVEKYRAHQEVSSDDPWDYRPYSFQLAHKHIPEMVKYAGLTDKPVFAPAVADFEQGMLVSVPLIFRHLQSDSSIEMIQSVLEDYYKNERFVSVLPANDFESLDEGFLSPVKCNNTNRLDLLVFGNDEQVIVTARLDNLGKGASGAAIQNMNIMLGIDEDKGLNTI